MSDKFSEKPKIAGAMKPKEAVEKSDLVSVPGAIDPDTKEPLLRSKIPDDKGKYTYYYPGGSTPRAWFKHTEDGGSPESVQDINEEAESKYLDDMRHRRGPFG